MNNLTNIKYLDSAASTKVDPRVVNEMLPYFTDFYGNASSKHESGKIAKRAIESAREQVAKIINSNKENIIFTSGATESINYVLKGFVESNYEKGNHIITAKTEHKAVLSTCNYLETKGYEVSYLNVDNNGLISLKELRDSVRNNTALIVIMYVNNETGVIQPIKEIGAIAREMNIAFFCDATQAIGKIPVDVEKENIDMLCFSGHKINGPKGIGVLYKRSDIELTPLIHGGNQENGNRSGTYNTPLIVGLGKACEIAMKQMIEKNIHLMELNNYLEKSIREITPFTEISHKNFRVNNIVNLIIPDLDSDMFINKFKPLALSNGSACNSEVIEESHVIKAMFPKRSYKNNYLRISFDKNSSKEDIDVLSKALKTHLKKNYAK